jgi:DNA-binding NtrC family response regulator
MSTAHVLVVDDEADIRALIQEILTDENYRVTVAANAAEARSARKETKFDLVLLDIWMPDTDGISLLREWSEHGELDSPVVIMSGHGTVDTAVEATRLGALDFIEKPLSIAKLLRTVERGLDSGRKQAGSARGLLPSLLAPVGRSKLMQDLRDKVQQYANHDSPVLLTGEPGTGRGAFARYIHALSRRSEEPLEILLAASLTESNMEAQLFGSEKNGEIRPGFFERAGDGTLLIEELSDLDDQAQKLLLSALEQRWFSRVGGDAHIELRTRILATVRDDYESAIERGQPERAERAGAAASRVCGGCPGTPQLLRRQARRLGRSHIQALQRRGAEPTPELPVVG